MCVAASGFRTARTRAKERDDEEEVRERKEDESEDGLTRCPVPGKGAWVTTWTTPRLHRSHVWKHTGDGEKVSRGSARSTAATSSATARPPRRSTATACFTKGGVGTSGKSTQV